MKRTVFLLLETKRTNETCCFTVRREDQHLRRFMPGANSDSDRTDELNLQSVHADLQKIRGMVFPVPRHPGKRRCTQATHHSQVDRPSIAVRLSDRQRWLEDQGDPRGDRCLDPGRL